ncbi:MAG: hypothetical protein Phog2KO_41970 [Phototrophicaceae bacterium]
MRRAFGTGVRSSSLCFVLLIVAVDIDNSPKNLQNYTKNYMNRNYSARLLLRRFNAEKLLDNAGIVPCLSS